MFLLDETFTDTHSQDSGERQFEKTLTELDWEKVPNWEWLFASRKQKLFFSVCVDDIKMARKKQNVALMWKKLMKDVDIEEPPSFLDHVYLGCTQRECKSNEKIIGQYNKMFESRISAAYDMEGHARKCVERYCESANKKTEQLFKVSHLLFGQEELENRG